MELVRGEVVSRRDECSSCGADLRCCLNCTHYDPSKNNQCAESEADWVSDKESANFCDWFEPALGAQAVGAKAGGSDDAKKAFEDLFKI